MDSIILSKFTCIQSEKGRFWGIFGLFLLKEGQISLNKCQTDFKVIKIAFCMVGLPLECKKNLFLTFNVLPLFDFFAYIH
jgi:hypothetical protein